MRAYWWNQVSNWGDKITPYILSKMTGETVEWSNVTGNNRVIACGSIIESAGPGDIVWGTGLISDQPEITDRINIKSVIYCSVRGPLTREVLLKKGANVPETYGDPGFLMPKFYSSKIVHSDKIGIIPHYADLMVWKQAARNRNELKSAHVIDILGNIERVMDETNSCDIIISSSLHGIIIGEALGKPTAFVRFGNRVFGGNFKFHDYYLSSGRKRIAPLDWTDTNLIDLDAAVEMAHSVPIPELDREEIYNSLPEFT